MRKKKEEEKLGTPAWIVTFSDLVTLLLTFFILILSMSSMERISVSESAISRNSGQLSEAVAGRIATAQTLIQETIKDPLDAAAKADRIKDLLFPDDILPPDIKRSNLLDNIEILQRDDGVALVLNDSLLFGLGDAKLKESAKFILRQIVPLLHMTNSPINVAGYTDDIGGDIPYQYELSGKRALAVLGFFIEENLPNKRFSISAYGMQNPMADNSTLRGRARNRRVEILLRKDLFVGGYLPLQ